MDFINLNHLCQGGSNFSEWQLINFLWCIKPLNGLLKKFTIHFLLDLDQSWSFYWIFNILPGGKFWFSLLSEKINFRSEKMTLTSPGQFTIDRTRKLSRTTMYTCALIVMAGPLNNIHPNIMNDSRNLLVFFRQYYLYVSLELYKEKLTASSPGPMSILDSWMNITFF